MDGPVAEHVRVPTTDVLVDTVAAADIAGGPSPIVGGGSSLLASDAPSEDTVVDAQLFDEVASIIHEDPANSIVVRAGTGAVWDAFVSWTLSEGLCGPEAFPGIPGIVGASPVQNVGAYGHEVSETIGSVETHDHLTGIVVYLLPSDLGFVYRSSAAECSAGEPGLGGRPQGSTGRWVALSMDFRLVCLPLSAPVMHAELAQRLDVGTGEHADASLVRSTVLDLHRNKDMVPDTEDHDTWSASSFFTNPILPEAVIVSLPEGVSRSSAGEGLFETSTAWLIDHTGRGKGFRLPEVGDPPCTSLSAKRMLALTNRGGATGTDIEALARVVHERAFDASGVILMPKPIIASITRQQD